MAEPKRVIRAKFNVFSVTHGQTGALGNVTQSEHIRASAVAADDNNEEHKKFWEATPSANLELYINNQKAWGTFKAGDLVYVDIIPAN
jgi:hypothetical protein